MATPRQKMQVGVFLLACGALMVGGLVLISGYKSEEQVPYWVEFEESVLGLTEGGIVEYLGVPVGQVKQIYVDKDGHAHIDILISPSKVTLHKGVSAKLVLYSLATGVLVVSLEGGDSTLPELPANSQIPSTPSLVSAVSSRVEQLMDSINDVVETVSKGLDGMEPGDLTKIADDVETLLTDARTFLDDMGKTFTGVGDNVTSGVDELKKLAKDLQELTQEMRETVRVARTKIETLDLGAAETNINETLKSLKTLTEHLDASIGTIDTVAQSTLNEVDNVEYNLRETMRSATETLESLRTLTESLGEDPSQLLRGKGKPAGGK